MWKFAKYYVGNFHNPSMIVQEICIRCNWQQFYFHFLPHSLPRIHSFVLNKCENWTWRSPEDENNHQPLDLQPKRGGPDQHLVQQHLQLHLHEEQVPALNSTSTCLRGLRNVPNFLNSQSNDQLVTLECLIMARLCIEETHFAIAESVNQSPSLFLFHSFIKFNILDSVAESEHAITMSPGIGSSAPSSVDWPALWPTSASSPLF